VFLSWPNKVHRNSKTASEQPSVKAADFCRPFIRMGGTG
jgi:hypothetical protein